MEYDQYPTFRNAVSTTATTQNWADLTKKISKKVAPFTKEYLVERFGCHNNGPDTANYVIDRLDLERDNITNLIEKSRVTGVINALKDSLKGCAQTGIGVNTNPNVQLDANGNPIGVPTTQSLFDKLNQLFTPGWNPSPGTGLDQTIDVNTGGCQPPLVSKDGACVTPKSNNTIWWIVGGVLAIGAIVGTVAIVRARGK